MTLKYPLNLVIIITRLRANVKGKYVLIGVIIEFLNFIVIIYTEFRIGTDFSGKLALWQIIARVIEQGSRLSAVRLAQTHAAADVLNLTRGFDEDDLYANLKWIAEHKKQIESELFSLRHSPIKPKLFLYDVTSSYLEGDQNYFADFGYNHDKKKGKKQIVIGLLCDEFGGPVSVQVFAGNTSDPKTVGEQVKKIATQFGCEEVTLVGDHGMIKNPQIAELPDNFHYITAITRPQIETLVKKGVFQYELFDNELGEVSDGDTRYILRRNPLRAAEIETGRQSKYACVAKLVAAKNAYLSEHSKAKVKTAQKDVDAKIEKLDITTWVSMKTEGRVLKLEKDETVLEQLRLLDGCYAIKTDLTPKMVEKEIVHARYKDLSQVETAFRNMKTVNLEVRPVYVQTEESTIAHVEVVMLAYLIIKHLQQAWNKFDLTVAEGLERLKTLCVMEVCADGKFSCKIPQPRESSQQLLNALELTLPEITIPKKVKVVTKKKLPQQRSNL